jgi:8-oxo-dGTP pyrophosphatase MutT (NUDIX family)
VQLKFIKAYNNTIINILLFVLIQGGWELDESLEEAACRESLEEAGVIGIVEVLIGFKKKKNCATIIGASKIKF